MLSDDAVKALIEAIIYVAPDPVSLEAMARALEGVERERIKAKLFELMNDYAWPQHGIQIRKVAGGYKFSSKPEHHEVLRKFVKSLKPPLRLSKPALETLAVIAYKQPATLPEINEIRGVDSGGVIHTLLERKLITTAGRKNVVGRPILYRTTRDFLVHFGLNDVSELPSLKEFEQLAQQALGPELAAPEREPKVSSISAPNSSGGANPPTEAPQSTKPASDDQVEDTMAGAPPRDPES